MGTEANKQRVRDFILAVWVDRNLAALPVGADNHGLGPLHAYHEQFFAAFAAFSDIRIEITQQVAEADKVVTQMTTRAKHTGAFLGQAPTGKTVALDTIRIDRLESGKIAEHWSVADMAGLMRQLK